MATSARRRLVGSYQEIRSRLFCRGDGRRSLKTPHIHLAVYQGRCIGVPYLIIGATFVLRRTLNVAVGSLDGVIGRQLVDS